MDVFEEFEKLWISGLHHQIKDLLDKNKDKIYPADYYRWISFTVKPENRSDFTEKWSQSINESDLILRLDYEMYHDITDLMVKVNYILNSPPLDANKMRDKVSKLLLEKINIFDELIEEANNFNLSTAQEDGYIHFNWSKTIWKNVNKIWQSDIRAMYHFLMLQPEKMILAGVRTVAMCTGELEDSFFKAAWLNNLAVYYRVVNDIDKNRETWLSQLPWVENFIEIYGYAPKNMEGEVKRSLIGAYSALGTLEKLEGDFIQAEKYFLKYLQYHQDGIIHMLLARFYIDFGNVKKAEYHLDKTLTFENQDPNDVIEAQFFTEKARLNILTGKSNTSEINSALEAIDKHLQENEFLTSNPTIETYFRVADIYMANSEFIRARKYYAKVSEMCTIVHYYDFHRAECLMKLIQIACIEGEDPEFFKGELDELVNQYSEHEKMALYQELGDAIILKHTKGIQRGASRFKAQEIFGKISRGKIYDINLHFFARFNYCELLLDAYQFYGEGETLKILVDEVKDLATMSKEKGLVLYNIEVLILRSKIATLQQDLNSSLVYLEDAQEIADKRNLITYQERIKTEKETYLNNLDSWNSMRKDDKIEKLKLKQYLKFAQQNITK